MGNIVLIDEEKCVGCGACASICPQKILVMDSASGKVKCPDDSACDKLAGCEHVCPVEAIKINN